MEKFISERNANFYFGVNHYADNYIKDFKLKNLSDYENIDEFLNNICISMNENVSLKSADFNIFYLIDKRLGRTYSLYKGYILNSLQNQLMESEELCKEFLTDYYNQNIRNDVYF
jgi:predicted ATPase